LQRRGDATDRHRDADVLAEELAADLLRQHEEETRGAGTGGEQRDGELLQRRAADVAGSPEVAGRRRHPVVGEFDRLATGVDLEEGAAVARAIRLNLNPQERRQPQLVYLVLVAEGDRHGSSVASSQ